MAQGEASTHTRRCEVTGGGLIQSTSVTPSCWPEKKECNQIKEWKQRQPWTSLPNASSARGKKGWGGDVGLLLEGPGGETSFFTGGWLTGCLVLRVVRPDLRFGRDWKEEISESTL